MNEFQTQLYTILSDMCKQYPNNMELGAKVRSLINTIEDDRKRALVELTQLGEVENSDPRQMNIFDIINLKENG